MLWMANLEGAHTFNRSATLDCTSNLCSYGSVESAYVMSSIILCMAMLSGKSLLRDISIMLLNIGGEGLYTVFDEAKETSLNVLCL